MSSIYYGKSVVSGPDITFEDNIKKLSEQSDSMQKYMLEGGESRDWNQALLFTNKKNPYNTANTKEEFSRLKKIDKDYGLIFNVESPGTDGDVKALKLQAAYLQAMERAMNLRYTGLAKSEALAAGRRKGQGDGKGPFIGPSGVLGYVQKIIEKSQR